MVAWIGYNASMSNQHTYKPPLTKEQLLHDYLTLGMSQCEIAAKWGTSQKVIWKAMRNFDIKARVAAKRNQKGCKNSSWKGTEAGYKALHLRVGREFGKPQKCDRCGTEDPSKSYDWANISGRYHDLRDYIRLCRSCHWKMDGKINNITHMRKERSK